MKAKQEIVSQRRPEAVKTSSFRIYPPPMRIVTKEEKYAKRGA